MDAQMDRDVGVSGKYQSCWTNWTKEDYHRKKRRT